MDHTRARRAEAFRTMRTAMMLCDAPPTNSDHSPEPGERQTLILQPGIAFAKSGMRVY